MSETAAEKAARERAERIDELRRHSRTRDLAEMVADLEQQLRDTQAQLADARERIARLKLDTSVQ